MKLGISINKDNLALARTYKNAGFSCAEITFAVPLDVEPDVARAIDEGALTVAEIRASGLEIWSFHIPFGDFWDITEIDDRRRAANVERVEKFVRAGTKWGKTAVLHASFEPITPDSRAARLDAGRKSVAYIARIAREAGARLALEVLPRTCIGNCAEELDFLTGGFAGVCFDVNHLLKESHADFMAKVAGKIITTHLSDYDGIDERHWLPGAGIVPWKELVAGLAKADYKGPFLFELRPDEFNRPFAPERVVAQFEAALK